MLFLLKIDQKNKANQNNFSKVEKLRDFLSKVRFVAKNLLYLKNWSSKKIEANRYTNASSTEVENSIYKELDIVN